MWVHLLAILGIIGGSILWWALQHASGGERLEKCGHGEGSCGSCGSRTDQCSTADPAPRP